MQRHKGQLIVLEGIDGAGTTTQAHELRAFFLKHDLPLHVTAEPSSRQIGQLIRQYLKHKLPAPPPEGISLLFAADRYDHLEHEILPALSQGTHVICDRYLLSSLAYQQAAGVSREDILFANKHIYPADLTILIDVSLDVSAMRRTQRALTQELYETNPFLERVRALYRKEATLLHMQGQRTVVIDGDGSLDQVTKQVRDEVQTLLQRR